MELDELIIEVSKLGDCELKRALLDCLIKKDLNCFKNVLNDAVDNGNPDAMILMAKVNIV